MSEKMSGPTAAATAAASTVSDGELLSRFASGGDQQAFSFIVQRHGAMVLRMCRRMSGGDSHVAEDAAQQVFLTLANRANALKTRTSVAGWLYRTAWNVATRQRRERNVRGEHELRAAAERAVSTNGIDVDAAARGESVPFAVISSELSDALAHALGNLPENYRDALVLHHLSGYTVAETAQLLDVRMGTAASWLSRGRTMLRERLEMLMAVTLAANLIEEWFAGQLPDHRHLFGDAALRNWSVSPVGRRAIAAATAGATPLLAAAGSAHGAAAAGTGLTAAGGASAAVGAGFTAAGGASAAGGAGWGAAATSISGATALAMSKPAVVAGAITASAAAATIIGAPYVLNHAGNSSGAPKSYTGSSSSSSSGGWGSGVGAAVPEPSGASAAVRNDRSDQLGTPTNLSEIDGD